jgi:hypothetical protein
MLPSQLVVAATPVPAAAAAALRLLLCAAEYAADAGGDPWQFAVELDELQRAGLTRSDLRWLLAKRLLEHADETTVPGDPVRSFRPLAPTAWTSRTCCLLTGSGRSRFRAELGGQAEVHEEESNAPSPDNDVRATSPLRPVASPHWDPNRRELRFCGQIVKRYRVPAPNQEIILTAFEEEGWPEFIDDPLIPDDDQEPKWRLQATIKSLNRHQLAPLIRFHGNGNGLQVHWDPA